VEALLKLSHLKKIIMKSQIAIISDDVLFSNLFIPLLEFKNEMLEIVVCGNLQEVDDLIDKDRCRLIIVDGGMIQMSSIEMMQYIRSESQLFSPIWFFTEIITESYLYKAQSIGANSIYHKPFDPYLVVDEIINLIQ
jgi:DNA-binding NarL/FixJ family response regulator